MTDPVDRALAAGLRTYTPKMLVGRVPEVRTITRLVAGARLGDAAVLALLGEPGVGKTALLEHSVAALGEEFRVLRATGTETERELAFAGLSQLLGPALDVLDAIPAPQAEALAAALALRSGRPGDRFAIGAATLSLVSRYAEAGPVALVVDDAHLLDRPTLEALAFAARRLDADPVLWLLAARTPDVGESLTGLPALELAGLDPEPAREVLHRAAGRPVVGERFAELYRRTAGNPLALQEFGADLGSLEAEAPGFPATAPTAVTRAFARRIGLLAPGARAVLLVSAAAGGDLSLAAAACGRLDLDVARLADAEDAALVTVREGRVEFRHPLLRAAAYSGGTATERHGAHRAVADALPPDDVDRRAWHLSEAVWGPDADVADLLARAADHALARSGYAVASSAYHRAALLSPGADERCRRLLRAGETAWAAGQPERATARLDELAGLDPRPDVAGGALELRAAIAARTGSLREALEMLLSAADRADSPDQCVVVLADAVHAAFYLGDTATSLTLVDRLTELTPKAASSRARALGLMACGIARVLAGRGGADEIRAAVPLLESSADLQADPRRWPWLLLAPLFLRDASGGTRLRARVEEIRGSAGVGMLPAVLFHVARDQATTDAWDRASANYTEAVRLADETGQATELAISLAGRCWLRARQGDEVGCREDAREALRLCAERTIHLGEAWVLFALGDLELSLGDATAAVGHFRELEDLLARRGMGDADLSPCPELVDALVRTGDVAGARDRVPAYVAAAEDKGQPWARARARRAKGLVAPDDELDAAFEDALALHAGTLDRFETARTRLAYGERLRRAGRRVDARPRLREALATFERLGAARWSGRAAAELTATGETVRRSEVGWRPALTPQELQVGLLLAEGRTTREAAAALFLSPKTVEYHLRKVYTKLGIHSRDELAAAMADPAQTYV
jgi:DNA-binding CsgD family transcriptional regulator